MGIRKQLAINFISQVIYSVINLGISFFLVPHIISSLNASAYAFINLSNDFINYASLITVALNSIAGRYITLAIHKKQNKEANIYYNSVIVANIIMASVLLIPMTLFVIFMDSLINIPANLLGDVRILFIIVFTNFIISLITSVFSSTTFVTNKLYLSSIASIGSQIVRCIALLVLFSLFETNVCFVGIASFASTLVIAISNYIFTKKLLPQLKFDFKEFDLKYTFEMVKNGVWNSVSKLSGILESGLDLLLSNLFIGPVAMGIIALPRTITSIVFSLFGSMASIFNPNIMQAYAKNDFDSIKRQLFFAIKFVATISNAFIATFLVVGLEFYKLWVPTENTVFMYMLSFISMCSLTIGLPLEPVYVIHTATNKIKQPAIVCLILSTINIILVICGVNLVADETLKMVIIYGSSTILGIIKLSLYIPVYTAKIMNEKWHLLYPCILKNIFIVAITFVIGLFIKKYLFFDSWILFFTSSAILGMAFMIINFFFNFNKEDKKEFYKVIKKVTKVFN